MGNTNVKPHPKPRNKKQLRWKAADRPSPPGKPSSNQENGLIPNVVQIHWTTPEKEGGSTVTSYLVEHKRLGSSHWLKSSTLPVLTNQLAVQDLEPGWRYQFRVRAENAVGLSDPSDISEPYTVTLQRSAIAAPRFTQDLNDIVTLENGKVEFEVHFLGQPPPNICWFKDGFEIFSGNRIRITTVSDKSVLTILHTTASDEGEIKCTATNRAGHASTKSKLTIEAPPGIKLPKSYQDQDGIIFEIGETIKLNVTVSGRPTPLIFWSHDGESIQNNDRYEIEYNDKIASVKIENAVRSDRGEYQLKAVNKLGQDLASFLVTITNKPTPPGKARVLLTSGKSVTLSWSTPEDDGGCRIGNYIIEYYRLGWNVWLKAATTRQLSTMLGDLIEGSEYKFRVKAESPYGVSDPSEESEVVFIPDQKRGIRQSADVKRNENESQIPKRRRANSSPRVSFILDDTPVRPERKKTGKTPEASPRLKRKEIPSLARNINVQGSDSFLNRRGQFSTSSGNSSPMSWENASTSPSSKLGPFSYPGISTQRMSPNFVQGEKSKSSSPEIIITGTDVDNKSKFSIEPNSEKSPSRIQNYFQKAQSGYPQKEISPSKSTDQFKTLPPGSINSITKSPSRSPDPHADKSLSQSANPEILPVLKPNKIEKLPSPIRIPANFERSPPRSPNRSPKEMRKRLMDNLGLDLNATRSTAEVPELREKEKSSSPQIMDRMRPTLTHQAFSGSSEFMLVLCPEGEQGTHFRKLDISFEENSIPPPLSLSAPELGFEPPDLPQLKRSASSTELLTYRLMERLHEAFMKKEETDVKSREGRLSIPTIQVNSEPTKEVIQENPTLSRRLSGTSSVSQSSWSHRRHSLKNAKDVHDTFRNTLHKFEDTPDMRREISEYRKISESESENADTRENTQLIDGEQWMEENEDLVTSELDSDSSSVNETKLSDVVYQGNYDLEEEEEIYNPRNRMMSATKADENKPFEILTVRKNPPDSNIIPKPILKKTPLANEQNRRINVRTAQSSDSRINNTPSTSIGHRSPTSITQNEISINDPTNSRKEVIQSNLPKSGAAKNVSALANFTSIAGAGFIIPNKMQEKKEVDEMQEKKEIEEGQKIVVDFYGDLVKNFGGKAKPTAEFSSRALSKYDTYEERKISDIKTNVDSGYSAPQNVRSTSPKSGILANDKYSKSGQKDVISQKDVSSSSNNTTIQSNAPITEPAKTYSMEGFGETLPPHPTEKKSPNNPSSVLEMDDLFRQMKAELSQTKISEISPLSYQKEKDLNRRGVERPYRESRTSSRPGSRQSSVGRRKRTTMSRDASTSPVRFLDDWDSRCSSRNSRERDNNRGSLTSSRASSLSRRSLSPPRPRSRAITTQTSFAIRDTISDETQQKEDLVKKAEKRIRVVFEYFTDLAMISVAASFYLFRHEYYAIPFLLILIYRQLGERIQKLNEAVKKWIPQWIRNKFGRKS